MLPNRRFNRFRLFLSLCLVLLCSACGVQPIQRQQVPNISVPLTESFHDGFALHNAQNLAFRALSLVGTPYRYGGESPSHGFDCSGLMRYIFQDALQQAIPRTAGAQFSAGAPVQLRSGLRLGDLVFFGAGAADHVGLYVGENRFVHAPRTGKNVQLSPISGYWRARFLGGRRYLNAKN